MAKNIDEIMNHGENPSTGFPVQREAVLVTSSGHALKDGV